MKSRKIQIHQVNTGSALRDGTTNTLFLVQKLLRDLGFVSEIFVDNVAPELSSAIRHTSELQPEPQDILLIHHGFCHDHLDTLAVLNCRKVLVYHSITPPAFFEKGSDNYYFSLKGYMQLATFRDIAEASIALSSFNARELHSRGFDNVTVLPFHKNFDGIRYLPHRKLPYYDHTAAYRILYVGRISPHKHQRELVQLVGEVRSIDGFPLELVLVGHWEPDSEYKSKIDDEIRALGLGNLVVMTGSIPDDELWGLYRSANAYVSFSEHEGFGIPLIEAMALDLPVIAFAAGGIAAAMGNAGIVIGDKRADTIRNHLIRLHTDGVFRREVIRKQRAQVWWYRMEHIVDELKRWLAIMGAYDTDATAGSLFGLNWAVSKSRVGNAQGGGDFATPPPLDSPATGVVRYVIEGPFETSYSLANSNRQMAVALNNLAQRQAYIVPAEGVEDYAVNELAASELPLAVRSLVHPPPLTDERVVTIRHMYPPRPNGMLGDVRLVHFPWEESAISSRLADLMNLHLDGVLVASEFVKRVLRNSGVRSPIGIIGHGVDHALPRAPLGDRSRRGPVTAEVPFTFLHISSGLPRKGIEELVLGYTLAFTSHDPVLLVIKTFDHEQNVVQTWVDRLAIGEFAPSIQIIAEELDRDQMDFLFSAADAAVLPTRGEAFNFPAAEAMARSIPVIVTGYGGHMEFCNSDNALLVDYEFEPSVSHVRVPGSLWTRASISDLVRAMRSTYQDGRKPDTPSAGRAMRAMHDVSRLRWSGVAERVDEFVTSLDQRQVMERRMRLGWISTYNARCGVATYSANLLEHLSPGAFDVTIMANHEPPIEVDPPNMVRVWKNESEPLSDLRAYLGRNQFDAVCIQFHVAFFDLDELALTLQELHSREIDTYIVMHRTKDVIIRGKEISLKLISETLKKCTRIFVHSVEDVNKLKKMGVVDNVSLFVHGAGQFPEFNMPTTRSLLGLEQFSHIIGSFGFLVPPKGFQALIHAFALVLRQYPKALLLMVTAQNEASESAEERERCVSLINDLGLQDKVRLISDFIEDEQEAVFLLSACDAIVFPYLYSMEAASGALRIGLASGRPVGSTPLPIFAEFGELIHQFSGISVADIADGIRALIGPDYPRDEVARRQREWIYDNSWNAQAKRMANVMLACFEDRHSIGLWSSVPDMSRGQSAGLPGETHASGSEALRAMIEAEFQTLSTREFISLTFRRTLGRQPLSEEIAHFERLDTDATTGIGRWRLIREIGKLAEGGAKSGHLRRVNLEPSVLPELDNGRFVEAVIYQLLLREPDALERERYNGLLENKAYSRRQLVDDLLASAEFSKIWKDNVPLLVRDGDANALDHDAGQAHGTMGLS